MRFAIKKDNIITNIIIADYSQKTEFEAALSAELIDLDEVNLSIGDLWNGKNWTRNINGEQVVINTDPAPEQLDRIEAQVAYTAMMTDTLLEEAQ